MGAGCLGRGAVAGLYTGVNQRGTKNNGRKPHTRKEPTMSRLGSRAPRRDTTRHDPSECRQADPLRTRPIGEWRRNRKWWRTPHPTRYRQKQAKVDPFTYRQYTTKKQINNANKTPPRSQRPDALTNRRGHYHPSKYRQNESPTHTLHMKLEHYTYRRGGIRINISKGPHQTCENHFLF